MADIRVTQDEGGSFRVTVEDASTTAHSVTLKDAYYEELTGGKVSREQLIEESFRFLLERESNPMILSRFALSVISRYFPEYEQAIVKRL